MFCEEGCAFDLDVKLPAAIGLLEVSGHGKPYGSRSSTLEMLSSAELSHHSDPRRLDGSRPILCNRAVERHTRRSSSRAIVRNQHCSPSTAPAATDGMWRSVVDGGQGLTDPGLANPG